LNIPELFKFSLAEFMCSIDKVELPNHFNNYFTDIASTHKYQTSLASLQKV